MVDGRISVLFECIKVLLSSIDEVVVLEVRVLLSVNYVSIVHLSSLKPDSCHTSINSVAFSLVMHRMQSALELLLFKDVTQAS